MRGHLTRGRGRLLAAAVVAVVVVADVAVTAAARGPGTPLWAMGGYAAGVLAAVAVGYRFPVAGLLAALVLASLSGDGYILVLWAAYHAGRAMSRPVEAALVGGAVLGRLGAGIVGVHGSRHGVSSAVFAALVFVALPLLVGRYLGQHDRLVAALEHSNRQLRRERELLLAQERLRERLRIARDMHDSLGHRLSVVSVAAAALEVSAAPRGLAPAIATVATAARQASDELHELIGALRDADDAPAPGRGLDAVETLAGEFRAAGLAVTVCRGGQPGPLSAVAGQAAYRVVEEGLTNAAKHAPGQPVTVSLAWEPDALLLTVTNPLPIGATCPGGATLPADAAARGGAGLRGLGERVPPAGGYLHHGPSGGTFRLVAMLPTQPPEVPEGRAVPAGHGRLRAALVGLAAAILMFGVLPAGMLVGVR